jgi:hypothetical protein
MVRFRSWSDWKNLVIVISLVANIVTIASLELAYEQLNLTREQVKLSENQSQTIFDGDISVNANFTNATPMNAGTPTNWYPGPLPSAKWIIDASQFKFVRVMYILNFSCSLCIADSMSARIWGEHFTSDKTISLLHGAGPFFSNYTITVSEKTYFTTVTIDCDTQNGPQVFCDFKGTVRAHLFIGTFSTRL